MESLKESLEEEQSQVASWYAGKKVLITGATGFMGKVLVEKLLRSCSDLEGLYLLIRPKRDLTPADRKDQYLKCVIFNKVVATYPDIGKKIHVIGGDVLEDNLGIHSIDRDNLIRNIDVIFHCAANVRFDQPLRPMIQMNVMGTLKVLELASSMENLKVFVHVSTTFCQCNEPVVEERAYPAHCNPYEVIKMLENMTDDEIAQVTPRLLNGLPNTYAFSKALSEDLINRYEHTFPIVITRPSIVTAAWREPLPGWVESINGPTGLIIGGARGVIRTMYCNPDNSSTIIPVDTAINGMIVAGYKKCIQKSITTEFVNLSVANKSLQTWGECIETGKRLFYKTPLSFSLWYPNGDVTKNYLYFKFCVIFFHYLPAYFLDSLLLLLRKKPFLVKVQHKVSAGIKLMQYYTTKEWVFETYKFEELMSNLNKTDADIFNMDTNQLQFEQYIHHYIMGIRKYMLGESDETIPRARLLLRFQYCLDCFSKLLIAGIVGWILWDYIEGFVESSDIILQSVIRTFFSYKNNTVGGS
ncbi:putative fatty acyl-CoA reductase CG5065 [Stomoxys calcitrans]|uniref:Fatty acyl-CoA reductase n=1 Tax=Stomoxys calcitrans TaxID=35570 RepID=A0A1I8P2D0_STOCA|nr:putative fatty acyl-CoA reductase CG5065 [Stomoxys calcitrans]